MRWDFVQHKSDSASKASGNPVNPRALGVGQRWFLVYTQPRKEAQAQFNLRCQNFHGYLPQVRKTIRHARRLRIVHAPLFPRYLFVALDLTVDPWLSVSGTIGVSSLFMCDGRPVPVPEGVVETLISAADDRDIIRLDDGLVPGDSVRVLAGPFAELIGTLQQLDGPARAHILVEIMGGAVPVSLHRSALARIEQPIQMVE
jgi:transcription elongation factor/antiterminator RfaH